MPKPATLVLPLMLCFVACSTVRQLKAPSDIEPDGKARRTRTDSALDYSVATFIAAEPEVVWSVLTDVASYKRWNSTIVRISGEVVQEGSLSLVSKVAPQRTFTLRVSELNRPHKMVWEEGNGMFLGVRHFNLMARDQGTVVAMSETYSGLFLGAAEKEMPDFTQNFETFAQDLKREAEARQSQRP